ncbi:hypothetical protein JTB14_032675 [Gonioctena quinquepunctata]|nr:hypothetical protein JTB14_032675 [Gonioctena quinquepunctata]
MEDDKDNAVSTAAEDFNAVPSSSKLDVPPVTNIDNSSTQNDDIQTLPVDWSRYTPKQLRTPKNKKLRPTMPISSSLQLAKEEYYKKKTVLLREEIELKNGRRRSSKKRQREEEEHEIKMNILNCDLKLKEQELNMNKK